MAQLSASSSRNLDDLELASASDVSDSVHSDCDITSSDHDASYDENEEEIRRKVLSEVMSPKKDDKKRQSQEKTKNAAAIMITAMSKAKQLAAKAFQDDLIERLPRVVENEPLFHAGTFVNAAARIYSYRVEATHMEAHDVRSKLETKKLKNKDKKDDGDEDPQASVSGEENEGSSKKKKQIKSCAHEYDSDEEFMEIDDVESQQERQDEDESCLNVNESSSDDDLDEIDSAKTVLTKLVNKADRAHASYVQTRSKANCIALDPSDLNDHESIVGFCGHLYCKATHKFNEGSSSGLLMENALTSRDGRRYMLHNDSRCSAYEQLEKLDGSELDSLYILLETAEKNMAVSINSTGAFDTTMLTSDYSKVCWNNETMMNLTSMPKLQIIGELSERMEKLLKDVSFDFDSGSLFDSRLNLQKKLNIGTKEFIALIVNSTSEMKPSLRDRLITHLLSPRENSRICPSNICGENGLLSAVLSDTLEIFEKSHDWVVFKQKWEDMKNKQRAEVLKKLYGEHPTYNYFFAKPSNSPAMRDGNQFPVIEPSFWLSKGETRKNEPCKEKDEAVFAKLLENYRHVVNGELFARKGDDFSRCIARVQFVVPKVLGAHGTSEGADISTDESRGKRIALDDMECPDFDVDCGMDNDDDVDAMLDLDNVSRKNSAVDFKKTDSVVPSSLTDDALVPVIDDGNAETAVGDLNFSINGDVLNIASSIVNDNTHWKRNPEDLSGGNGKQKNVEKSKKKDKLKNKGMTENFEWDDATIAKLRRRERQIKKKDFLLPSSELFIAKSTYNGREAAIAAKMFFHLYHTDEEFSKLRMQGLNGISSDELFGCIDVEHSSLKDINREKKVTDFFHVFKHFFNESSSDSRDESVITPQSEVNDLMNNDLESTNVECENDSASDSDISSVEEAEIFGVKYAIRQQRINILAVKRAIRSILSDSKLAAKPLDTEVTDFNENEGSQIGEGSLCSKRHVSQGNDRSNSKSGYSYRDQGNSDRSFRFENLVVNGRHTFLSILNHLPKFLTGRTLEDLNAPIVFSVLLHMCNENELELVREGPKKEADLGDFLVSSIKRYSRKRAHS